jgi:DNA-binding transcriptional ArsR family regulator
MRMNTYDFVVKYHPLPSKPHPDDLEFVTATLNALADPTRVRLSLLLAHGERTVGDLTAALELPQSTVSRHLAVLRGARLVTPRRAGNRVHYRLSDAHVGEVLAQLFAHSEHKRLALPDHPATSRRTGKLEVTP